MGDDDLDTLFDTARAQPPKVPADLMQRVMQDAAHVQQAGQAGTGWRGWIALLGGARGVSGLITATCVGFWIGVAPPQALPDFGALVLGQATVESAEEDTSLFGWDIEEG